MMNRFLFLLPFLLGGCSALMPTHDIPSKDAVGEYPAIGAVPQGETQAMTEDERAKLTKELEAARAKNQRAVSAPIPKADEE